MSHVFSSQWIDVLIDILNVKLQYFKINLLNNPSSQINYKTFFLLLKIPFENKLVTVSNKNALSFKKEEEIR